MKNQKTLMTYPMDQPRRTTGAPGVSDCTSCTPRPVVGPIMLASAHGADNHVWRRNRSGVVVTYGRG
jgi:hypothetical protein